MKLFYVLIITILLLVPRYSGAAPSDDEKQEVKFEIDSAHSVLKKYHSLELSGELTRDEAMKQALFILAEKRYNGEYYLFVFDDTFQVGR